jgi:hypothetical protein
VPSRDATLRLGAAAAADAVEALETVGAAHLPNAVAPGALTALTAVGARVTFTRATERVGDVRQAADIAVVGAEEIGRSPPLRNAAASLARWVAEPAFDRARARGFEPNEATWMRYAGRDEGISPHLDPRRYRVLVAIFTIAGRGELAVTDDRVGRAVVQAWPCAAGDLVLLRAPGLFDLADGRVLHRVRGEAGGRMSLTFRMDAERHRPAVGSPQASPEDVDCMGAVGE